MSTRKKGIPVLLAEPDADGVHVRAWCPYCVAYHYHGGEGGKISAYGHRGAHCVYDFDSTSNSPFISTGYYLKRKK